MSNEPSFEAACRTLEDMFPDLDPIVVRSVLDAKDGNVNEATTKLLAMSRSKRGGGGMSSSSGGGGGGGGGYGDAPRSESMANGGEEINPYTKDARYDDDDDDDDDDRLSTLFFSRARHQVERERGVCALDHHHLCACDRCEKTRDQGTTRPRIQGKMHVTASQKMCLAGIRDHRARLNAFEPVLAPMFCVRLDLD